MPYLMHIDRPRGPRVDSLSVSSRYYRPPRSSSRNTSHLSLALQPVADTQSPPPSSSIDTESKAGRDFNSPDLDSTTLSLSSRSTTPRLSDSTTSTEIPLGPRWNNYSFREVDLAYGRLPEHSSNRERIEPELRPHKRHVSNTSILSLLKWPAPKQKGFEVDRPRGLS